MHTLLRSADLVWRGGPWAWLGVLVLCGALLTAALLWWRAAPRDNEQAVGPARGWVVVGPVLVLHLVVSGLASRPLAVLGWSEPAAGALVLVAHALGVVLVAAGWARWRWAGLLGALLVLGGLAGAVVGGGTPAVAAGHLALPPGIALCLAAAFRPEGSPRRAALSAAAGLLLFVLLGFGYYAAYDMALPVDNRLFLAVAAVLVALAARRPAVTAPQAGRRPALVAAAAVVVAVAGTGLVAAAVDTPAAASGDGFPVRVMLYNLQMGFDTAGRYSGPAQGEVIAGEAPDLVVLNEVSRGWLVNANVDVLPAVSERTGLPARFFPAADPVWGNAILARHPLQDVRGTELPRSGAAMRRSVLSAVVDLGAGQQLGVVATHLHHVEGDTEVRRRQVEVVDAEARRLAAGGRPVVVMGDMNAEPGSPELAPLESWLVEAGAVDGPLATWPSWDPEVHIDLVYTTPDLRAEAVSVPRTEASDHLGVAVTLRAAD
jgi:endonuclease/exonuclease/phosphatase family metal-dependent hydrolase